MNRISNLPIRALLVAGLLAILAGLAAGAPPSAARAQTATTPLKVRAFHILCTKGEEEEIPKPIAKWAKTLRKTGYNVFRIASVEELALETGKTRSLKKIPGGLGTGNVTLLEDTRVTLDLRNPKKEKVLGAKSRLPLANLVEKLKTAQGETYLLLMQPAKQKK